MTRIYLIRHGETEWNRELIFRGRADVPLSDRGREQARLLGAALRDVPLAAIYASPLSRAAETAEALAAGRNLAVQSDEALIDMNFGEWEGLSVEEVKAEFPAEFARWEAHPESAVPAGGEGLADIRARFAAGLGRWVAEYPATSIALVTHRVVCKVAICEVLDLDNAAFWRVQQDLCAVNLFVADGGKYVLHKLNETCHLRALSSAAGVDF